MKKIVLLVMSLCAFMSLGFAETLEAKGVLVTLSAQAVLEVPNDEVVIQFRVEASGKQAAELRTQVNRVSAVIAGHLKDEKGVKLETTNRRIDPIWKNDVYGNKRTGWRVVQTSSITSTELDQVTRWLDMIENAGAKLQALSFRVSDELQRITEDKLRLQAIASFRDKAAAITQSLGAKYFSVLSLNTTNAPPIQPMRREMGYMAEAMVSSVTAPVLAAGDGKIVVRVDGQIEVEKRKYLVH